MMKNRNTIQRSLVLEAVKNLRNHATADEIHDAIVKKHPDISRATVYRNLNLLSNIGEIRKVEVPNGAVRYDHQCHMHYHARCDRCDRIVDVEMEIVTGLERSVQDTHGFEFTGHDIMFKGTCPDCRA